MIRVAIVGTGMAGLACARRLASAGVAPVLFDKGRGPGGRLATRRAEGLQFDHGAQYVTARDPGFAGVLQGLQTQGVAAPWPDGSGRTRLVGVPGMSGLARAMAQGLDVRQQRQVTSIRPVGTGWVPSFSFGSMRGCLRVQGRRHHMRRGRRNCRGCSI